MNPKFKINPVKSCKAGISDMKLFNKVNHFPFLIHYSVFLLSIFLLPKISLAATYYVSATGWVSNWQSAINRATPGSYLQANANAVAGDTIMFINDAGPFNINSSGIINPANNGTPDNSITFKGEAGNAVILNSTSWSVELKNSSYINIENFTFETSTTSSMWVTMRNYGIAGASNHHINIRNCIFKSSNNYWAAFYIDGNNSYINIINNQFIGGVGSERGPFDLLYLVPGGPSYSIHHVLIENNSFYGGSHVSLEFQTGGGVVENNVIRNNIIHNPNHTSLNMYGQGGVGSDSNLIENNDIYDAGAVCVEDGNIANCSENVWGSSGDRAQGISLQANFQFFGDSNIIRYNRLYHGGIGFIADQYAYNNRIYNNVFYKNTRGFYFNSGYNIDGNTIVNNIFKDNDLTSNEANYPVEVDSLPNPPCLNTWRNNDFSESNNIFYSACDHAWGARTLSYLQTNTPDNWYGNLNSDPLFVNTSASDFHLQPSSPAIDAGVELTTLASSDSGTGATLIVNDAKYFSDGKGIVQADWITVGTVANAVQISLIDYSTNTITLATGISRNAGDKVWLYKNSSGQQMLFGTAPDLGAYEVVSAAPPPDRTPPAPPSGIVIN